MTNKLFAIIFFLVAILLFYVVYSNNFTATPLQLQPGIGVIALLVLLSYIRFRRKKL